MMTQTHKSSPQSGITLIETILVVGLLSGVMLVLTLLLQDFGRREKMAGVAGQMALVQRAVTETFSQVSAFDALYKLAEEPGNGNVVEISILHPNNTNRTLSPAYGSTWNVSLEQSQDFTLADGEEITMPASYMVHAYDGAAITSRFRDTLPIRAFSYYPGYDGPGDNAPQEVRLTILVHPIIQNNTRALEILIVSVDRLSEPDLRGVTAAMGSAGGFVSAVQDSSAIGGCAPNCVNFARGALGNWRVPLNSFSGTRWYDVIRAGAPASVAGGGYLASYLYINETVIAGDYLYRRRVAGNESLNQMNAPLDLGQNNLIGVDNIRIEGSGTALTVSRSVHAQGSAFVGGNLTTNEGDLRVNGDVQTGQLTVQGPPGTNNVYGNIGVGGDFTAQGAMTTSGDVYVMGTANMNGVNVNEVSAGTVTATSMTGGSNGILVGTLDGRPAVTASGLVQSSDITVRTVIAPNAGIVQGEFGSGALTVNTEVDLLDTTGKVVVGGKANIANLVECKIGC